ncbi:oligoribonuclease [Derxia gummosa]|uniref:Oligoribonuclease n=1 Tax=Derxia gummosa DSM 723 TaxID=1121388 RepID=A0A8B6X2I2_9BURK|nr:oligoribonuclease [Derxia gummosa]
MTTTAAPATPVTGRHDDNLVWVDMEMTGLSPDTDRVLEIAIIVTDAHLNVLAEGPVIVLHQSDAQLDAMDAWNKGTHGRSGLIDKVKASTIDEEQAQAILLDFMRTWVPKSKSPMCGNTICQDRRFMARWLPKLEAYFHYRNIDVSTLKELARRWKPGVVEGFRKAQAHTALADIRESIEELKHYRQHFLSL